MGATKKRVLLADDDMDVRALVRRAIASLDVEIIEARDGEETLEAILVEEPDLIVLDVMMPTLNGWEILKYIRSKPEIANTAVLMLTGVGRSVNALTAPLYGADAYLDKPFEIDDVVEAVRRLLDGRPADGA
jgi:DNA-binding response OmpR family regulator